MFQGELVRLFANDQNKIKCGKYLYAKMCIRAENLQRKSFNYSFWGRGIIT